MTYVYILLYKIFVVKINIQKVELALNYLTINFYFKQINIITKLYSIIVNWN